MKSSFSGTVRVVGRDAKLITNDRGTSIAARVGLGSFGGFIWADLWINPWSNDDATTVEETASRMKKGTEIVIFNASLGTRKRKSQDGGTETDQPTLNVSFRDVLVPTAAPAVEELSEEDQSPF